MCTAKPHSAVFLIPAMALVLDLLATAADGRRSEIQVDKLLQQKSESDVTFRLLVSASLAPRPRIHLQGFYTHLQSLLQ